MRLVFCLVWIPLLAACQGGATLRDPLGGSWVDLAGATLALVQPLKVDAGRARVFVQNGVMVRGFDHYSPHCAFEIRSVDHAGVEIRPDEFQISQVSGSLQQVVALPPTGLQRVTAVAAFGGHDSSYYYLGYHFMLRSPRQPEVMRMSCYGAYAPPYELQAPNLAEIRATLHGIASIVR
ncbi:MAG: hypothetical protein KDI82_10970 [Gammaproteobacteria bacterium]|nr:hypothetical protein [Gammaproteobacteria bacterium]